MLLSHRSQQPFYSGDGRAPLPPRRVLATSTSLRAVGSLVAASLLLSAATLALLVQTTGWRGAVLRGVSLRATALPSVSTTLLATGAETETDAGLDHLLEALRTLQDDGQGGAVAMGVSGAAVQFALAFDGQHVTPGDVVPVAQARAPPAVLIRPLTASDGQGKEQFACVLVDIDAPDPASPTHAPFLHYAVANLSRGDNAPPADAQAPPVVVPYFPVSPPTGEHRYVALLLLQTAALARDETESARLAAHRANFDLVGFARAHGLRLVATSTFYSRPPAGGQQ